MKKRVIESNERRERQSRTRNYPLIGFRKPVDKKADAAEKAENEEASETAEADNSESVKEEAPVSN